MEKRTVRKATAYIGEFQEWNKFDTDYVIDKVRTGSFISLVVEGSRDDFDSKTANICSELVNYGLMYGRDYVIQNIVSDLKVN